MLSWDDERMPLRMLEHLMDWKRREAGGAALIRQMFPLMEPAYERTLREWEALFARTADAARATLAGSGTERASEGAPATGAVSATAAEQAKPLAAPPEEAADPAEDAFHLARAAVYQSREFVRQLGLLQARSAVMRSWPAASALLQHIREESERFLQDAERFINLSVPNGGTGRAGGFRASGGEPVPADGAPGPGDAAAEDSSFRAPPDNEGSVPIGGHTLPPLPYPYNALEPYIDERTMRIHHDRHHRAYVEGLNLAEKKLEEARRTGNFDLVKHWERELAFNGAGHYLHTLFWETMSPDGGGRPGGELATQITRDFGSLDAFRRQFSAAAEKVEGGGWAILVWSPRSRRLEILTAEKHQNLSQWDAVPLLPLDVWEHAYYLKHQNDRAAYIRDWWHVVNWPAVEKRFAKARTLRWSPPA